MHLTLFFFNINSKVFLSSFSRFHSAHFVSLTCCRCRVLHHLQSDKDRFVNLGGRMCGVFYFQTNLTRTPKILITTCAGACERQYARRLPPLVQRRLDAHRSAGSAVKFVNGSVSAVLKFHKEVSFVRVKILGN